MGDARLTLERRQLDEKDRYGILVVDAFSSDAIPAHLLTTESFEMYFKHLAPDGVLCVHTSNRFVDLPKVVAAVASKMELKYLRGHDNGDEQELSVSIRE